MKIAPIDNAEYFLGCDNSSHWYVIPARCEREWDDFVNIPEDDERSWSPPIWAIPIGGSPSLVKFKHPILAQEVRDV